MSQNNGGRERLQPDRCKSCSLSALCLPVALHTDDIELLDRIVQRRRPLSRNEELYGKGDRFRSIYAVRSGALKSHCLSPDGEEQITGFHLPGELLGFGGIGRGCHPSTAVALETTHVCEIPFDALDHLSETFPELLRQLLRIMSRELDHESEMLQALARRSAEERVAIVLLEMRERYRRRGLSETVFRLPMTRHDLSNYLGLAPETLSRIFRRFSDQEWVSSSGREVTLLDPGALENLAGSGIPFGHPASA